MQKTHTPSYPPYVLPHSQKLTNQQPHHKQATNEKKYNNNNIFLGLIAFTLTKRMKKTQLQKNASISVRTSPVATEEISLDFSVNGNFEPVQELTFQPKIWKSRCISK
jgi:hypothetical protein